jgi:hypothetical protein
LATPDIEAITSLKMVPYVSAVPNQFIVNPYITMSCTCLG